jgi:DNA-binding beta-propeller fold protein YncE
MSDSTTFTRTVAIVAVALAIARVPAAVRPAGDAPTGRLFFLDIRGGRVVSAAPDGSDVQVLISGRGGIPDGIAADTDRRQIYWTIMGKPAVDDGIIERADFDGGHLTTVVPAGGTFTPKQLKLDPLHRKLYWSDREGMRVMRADLDGTHIETLVETGHGDADRRDARNWCVGIALDVKAGKVYWTQKGGDNAGVGSIRRASMERPAGEDAGHRSDIEVLFDHLAEPIDLDLDLSQRMIYWTDRGSNTVSRAPIDPPPGAAPATRTDRETLMSGLEEAIGIVLAGERMYVTDLGGFVYSARLDGSEKRTILSGQGSLTGITFVAGRNESGSVVREP